ncbi:MAG: rhodanese-like domain-containing protein [Thiomargarita sp.]|nr:rhodanese-like domain-containing protein [Thiomargarita sp.]
MKKSSLLLLFILSFPSTGLTAQVNITAEIESVTVIHNGRQVTIIRNQDQENTINSQYAKTSRPCPPYCIKPMMLTPEVETIGVLEVLNYLQQKSAGDDLILVIDARTVKGVINGSIPGSVSIPWDVLSGKNATPAIVRKILEQQLGVKVKLDGEYCFKHAKTLILFCNGPWCNKSTANINTLLELDYPAAKLKWYRGGMQSWESYGLTTITDIPMPWLGL